MRLPPFWVLAGLALPGSPLAAQIDYRNLDDDRPVLTEDAYPVERYAFELLLPYAFERERGGERLHVFVPEIAYGLVRNGHVGLKLPIAGVRTTSDTRWGLAGLHAFVLYNLNTDGRRLPAVSLRVDAHLPVGALGGDDTRATLKAIATRGWGLTRIHLNASWTVGDESSLAAAEPGSRWQYSLAVDRTLFRQSLLLIGEVAALRTVTGAPVEVNLAAGVRTQWTPTLVLDLGIARRLRRRAGPDVAVTVGVSHAFALAGLMPGAR